MVTRYIGNRHAGLSRFLQYRQLLIQRIPTAALDRTQHFNSIATVRHRRMTKLTPSSQVTQLCPVEMGAAPRTDWRRYWTCD